MVAAQLLDLLNDRQTLRLFLRDRPGPLLLGRPFLLTLGDRFSRGLARALELLGQPGLDVHVGAEFRPLETDFRQRAGRFLGIGNRDHRFRAMQQQPATLKILVAHAHCRLGLYLRRLFDLPQLRLRAPARHLVAGALRHTGQRLGGVEALERSHRAVRVLGFQGDVQEFTLVGHARQRAETRLGVGGVAADGPEGLRLVDEVDHRGTDGSVTVLARDHDHLAGTPQCGEMAHGIECARRLVGLGREPGQAAHGLVAHLFVRVGAGHFSKDVDVVDAIDGRTTDARIGVFTRQRAQRLGLVGPEFVNGGRADSRIGMLPARLGAKFFENTHGTSVVCRCTRGDAEPCHQCNARAASHRPTSLHWATKGANRSRRTTKRHPVDPARRIHEIQMAVKRIVSRRVGTVHPGTRPAPRGLARLDDRAGT